MVGIVVALYSEASSLIEKIQNQKSFKIADKPAYSGTLNGHNVVLAISGIGKVSAALTTQRIIDDFNPDFILNFGTCGGMDNTVKIKEYYAIENCCQFDFDLRELDGVPLGYIQEYKTALFPADVSGLDHLKKRNLATADRFITSPVDVKNINDCNCSLGDMEGGAIAQVCLSNKTPVVIIKGISDVHGSGVQKTQFFANLAAVGAGFPTQIIRAIDSVCKAKNIKD